MFQIFGAKYEMVFKPFHKYLQMGVGTVSDFLDYNLYSKIKGSSETIAGAMLFTTLSIKIASTWTSF